MPDVADDLTHIRTPGPRTKVATPDQLARMLTSAAPWLRLVLLLCLRTGMRRGDALTVSSAHYNQETVTLTWTQRKTDQPHSLPVSEDLAAMLDAAPAELWPGEAFATRYHNHVPPSRASLGYAWTNLKKKTGADPELWLHDLRRTAADTAYTLTKDLRLVAQLLGHTSLGSTVRYMSRPTNPHLREIIAQMWRPQTEKPQ